MRREGDLFSALSKIGSGWSSALISHNHRVKRSSRDIHQFGGDKALQGRVVAAVVSHFKWLIVEVHLFLMLADAQARAHIHILSYTHTHKCP